MTTMTNDEQATLKLYIEFNNAVRAGITALRADMAQKRDAITADATAKVNAMTDDEIDSAVIKTLVDSNPPMPEAVAKAQIAQVPQEAKAAFVAELPAGAAAKAEAQAEVDAMSDAEVDEASVQGMVAEGFPEAGARQEVANAPREYKAEYVVGIKAAEKIAATMSEADIDAAAVQGLMAQYPGTSEAAAKEQLTGASKDDKVGFLVRNMVDAEVEKLPQPEHPAKALMAAMNVDPQAEQAKLNAIVQKYGQQAVREELVKLSTPPQP